MLCLKTGAERTCLFDLGLFSTRKRSASMTSLSERARSQTVLSTSILLWCEEHDDLKTEIAYLSYDMFSMMPGLFGIFRNCF